MCSFKYRNLFKVVFCFALFFVLGAGIEAKYNSVDTTNPNPLLNCDGNGCVPLCIYTCDNAKNGCKFTYNSGSDYGYIGHYFTGSGSFENDDTGIQKIWSIGVLRSDFDNKYYSWTEDALPNSNIKAFEDDNKSKNFNESSYYSKMNTNYVCPSYIFMDVGSNANLFVSSIKKPTALTNDFIGLSYSFIDEFENVLKDMELEAKFFDLSYEDINKSDRLNEFLKIMNIAGLNSSYDPSLSSDENVKNFCSNTDVNTAKKYVKDFSIDKMIDAMISESLKNVNVRYPNVYSYSNFQTLFVNSSSGGSVSDTSGKLYKDRINDLYKDVNLNMIKYLNEDCNWNITEEDLNDAIIEELESQTHQLTPIDLDEKLDCSNLFAGDVANLISGAYFILEIVAILILIVFSVIDYAKVILNGDGDEIKKCHQKLIKRLIIVMIIFLLPALVNTVLWIFNIEGFNSDNPLCVRISNK